MSRDKQIEEMANIIALKAFERAHEIDGDENLADIVADALSVITSQEQRIKELTERNGILEAENKVNDRVGEEYITAIEEIEKLEAETKRLESLCVSKDIIIGDLSKENERLRADCAKGANALIEEMQKNRTIEADTVRKMQDELKKTFSALCKGEMVDLYRIIDQIAKEMLEGGNE